MRTAEIQISLRIYTVWSESKFSTLRNIGPLATHRAPIEGSDQTALVRNLIRVFDARTCKPVPFPGHRIIMTIQQSNASITVALFNQLCIS